MNDKLREYQIQHMVFQAKKTNKDILTFIKVFGVLGIIITGLSWTLF